MIAEFALTESLRALAISIKAILLALVAVGAGVLKLLSQRFPPPRTSGDLAGGYTVRTSTDPNRAVHAVSGSDDAGVGLNTILATLGHTGDEAQIFTDEFELIMITHNRFIVVLPGVTDLSRPHYGLNPYSRTVRDLDQYTLESNASVGVDGNRYAQMVMEALVSNGVPLGADVMLVGHSFGADTALDLAADARFNGPGGFNVTHAVARGTTAGRRCPSYRRAPKCWYCRTIEMPPSWWNTPEHPLPVASIASWAGSTESSLAIRLAASATSSRRAPRCPCARSCRSARSPGRHASTRAHSDRVRRRRRGIGHAQSNYLEYLGTTDEPAVRDFAASVGAAGYGDHGSIIALDISVPTG